MAKRGRPKKDKTKKALLPVADVEPNQDIIDQKPDEDDTQRSSEGKEELEEMKKATGIKTGAKNQTGINTAKHRGASETKKRRPSLFIKESDRIRVEADVLFDGENGKPMLFTLSVPYIEKKELKFLERVTYWAEFTIPRYDDILAYRESALKYVNTAEQFLVDPIQMRFSLIQNHLKDWNVENEDGEVVDLKFESGRLSKDTMDVVGSLYTTLMDIFLTEFERQAVL